MVATTNISTKPLDSHVQLAVVYIRKLKAANRPTTEEKLKNMLYSRHCYRFRHYLPPSSLAKAILPHLSAIDAEGNSDLCKLVNAVVLAAEESTELGSQLPTDWVELAGKSQAERLLQFSTTSSAFASHPIDAFGQWLCENASVTLSTDVKHLLEELKKRSIITSGTSIQYDEANIKAFKLQAISPPKIEKDTWLNELCGSMTAQKKFLKDLEGCSKAFLEIPFFSMPCSKSPIPMAEFEALRSKLRCGFDFDHKAGFIKISRLKETFLSSALLQTISSFVVGKEPALHFEVPHGSVKIIVGKGGRHIQAFEASHSVRLSITEDGKSVHGWLTAGNVPDAKEIEKDAAGVVNTLRNSVRTKEEKLRNDVEAHVADTLEKTAQSNTGNAGCKKRPVLARTFSSEYQALKEEREAQRSTAMAKQEQRKEHLTSKAERLATKRGRRKDKDKGDAMHGGRHKGSDMVAGDLLPPSSDSEPEEPE